MIDEEGDVEVVASGMALQQVSAWLGVDAGAVLQQETDPAIEAMFDKPHPSLLGLGAKYLSHKSMEASGLELKLKHKLRKSAAAAADDDAGGSGQQLQYQPAQLDRFSSQHNKRRKQDNKAHLQQQRHAGSDSDDDEAGGKLGRLRQRQQPAVAPAAAAAGQLRQHPHPQPPLQKPKVLDRSQLLQVPMENLSKWQRKRMREKAKKQQQQQSGGNMVATR